MDVPYLGPPRWRWVTGWRQGTGSSYCHISGVSFLIVGVHLRCETPTGQPPSRDRPGLNDRRE